jgi:uncharacterized membrane protein YidH (DUF202 family)
MLWILRKLVLGALLTGVSLLLGVTLALVMTPLWRWLEAETGIESIGHSGPSTWCYLACSTIIFAGISVLLIRSDRRRRR